ncbi:MAG: endoglucanase [Solirubrobacterales bacterium]|nr:MAG: endoglucanase [Solirubrobacterales bacterium]
MNPSVCTSRGRRGPGGSAATGAGEATGAVAVDIPRSLHTPLTSAAVPTPDLLRALLTAPGPSGYETAAATVWREAARRFAEVSGDTLGSSVARVKGSGGPRLAIVGHIDEIGLIVTHVSDEGFLYFEGVGGWDAQILVGQRVEVATRAGAIPGVVGKKPIHLLREEERKKVSELRDLHIDIGAKDGDEARGLVRVGDVAVIAGEPVELPNGRIVSRALDNRLGAYVALEAARLVAEGEQAAAEVAAVAAVQEEITFAGSRTTVFALDPQVAIAVDVTFATDAPGVEAKELGEHKFGSGPVIGRGSTLSPHVVERLCAAAEAAEIPYTLAASSRSTGTDADAIQLARAGIPTGVVSIPLRYMHSPVEMVQLDDVEACARLIAAFAEALEADASFQR